MKSTYLNCHGLNCLIFFLTITLSTAQHDITGLSLKEHVLQSDLIVEGEIVSQQSYIDDTDGNIYTVNIIKPYKIFQGDTSNETVEVITPGGVVGLKALEVSHSLNFELGDIGTFMLKKNNKDLNLSGKSQNSKSTFYSNIGINGFYKYDLTNNMAVNSTMLLNNIKESLYAEITKQTQKSFIEKNVLNVTNDASAKIATGKYSTSTVSAPNIASFSTNNVSAGTGSILTITGSGFGSSHGKVGFSDANFGGYLYYDALDKQIKSWSNNKVEVIVPDRAGTGKIKITTSLDESIVSTQDLKIDYAQINLEYASNDYQTQHIDKNGSGGYTWTMNNAFSSSGAKEAFKRAFESWTCSTGVNWDISKETTTINKNANDGVNIITFDSSMGSGTLGQCYSRYEGCYQDGEIKWYVTEMDIVFNPNKNWNYSTAAPTRDQVDFETVTVHELGHGHQLGHVVDTNVVMHYSISSGESLRQLHEEDLAGAIDVQSRSTTDTVCNEGLMTQSSCYASSSLSTNSFEKSHYFTVFPNPATDKIQIQKESGIRINKITLYDVIGKKMYSIPTSNQNNEITVNLADYRQGMYLVQIDSEIGIINKKLLVN